MTGCGKRATGSIGLCGGHAYVYVKQFKLLQFMAADGINTYSFQIDGVINNGNQVVTVRSQTDYANFLIYNISPSNPAKGLMNWLAPGNKVDLSYQWGDSSSIFSPADYARQIFNVFNQISPRPGWMDKSPFATESGCAMVIGQLGAKKFPMSFLQDVFSGQYGEFVDLSQDAQIVHIDK